jgi:hypothetical protein
MKKRNSRRGLIIFKYTGNPKAGLEFFNESQHGDLHFETMRRKSESHSWRLPIK